MRYINLSTLLFLLHKTKDIDSFTTHISGLSKSHTIRVNYTQQKIILQWWRNILTLWYIIITCVWSCWRTSLRATLTDSSLPVMTTERLLSFARLISMATPVHRCLTICTKRVHHSTNGENMNIRITTCVFNEKALAVTYLKHTLVDS